MHHYYYYYEYSFSFVVKVDLLKQTFLKTTKSQEDHQHPHSLISLVVLLEDKQSLLPVGFLNQTASAMFQKHHDDSGGLGFSVAKLVALCDPSSHQSLSSTARH
jgi:hypothetical protein